MIATKLRRKQANKKRKEPFFSQKAALLKSLMLSSEQLLVKFCEVLNRSYHLAGVGVFVVVPGNNLYLGLAISHGENHSLSSVKQRTESHTYYVGRNDFVGVVTEGFVSSSFHSSVDFFFRNSFVYNCNEDGGGTGSGRNALCGTDELAVEFGDNKTDSLSSAGAVRNDVHSACSGSSEVALSLGTVKDHLVAGVSVNGSHDTCFDTCKVVKSFSHRSEAVGRAGSSGNDVVLFGKSGVVNVVNDGGKVVTCGSGNNNFLSAGVDVSLCFSFAGVEARAFENYVNFKFTPRKFVSFSFSIDGNLLAVYNDVAVFFNGAVLVKNSLTESYFVSSCIVALHGVVFEKVSEHLGAGEVVDSDYFIAFSVEHLSESETTDTTKTVNCYFYVCHNRIYPPKIICLYLLTGEKDPTGFFFCNRKP